MMAVSTSLRLLAALLTLQGVFSDYTNVGFSSCKMGNNNIDGQFMQNKYGPLGGGDMEFRLDGFCMHVENCTDTIIVGREHELSLVTTREGASFIGFLWRVSGPDGVNTTGMVSAYPNSTDIQVSPICINEEQVGGMTHTEDSNKTVVKAKFMIDKPFDTLTFQVTAVVVYQPFLKIEYYYNSFTACVAEGPSAAPSGSLPSPTPQPIAQGIPASPAPTVSPPTPGPTEAATPGPTEAATPGPTEAATPGPTEAAAPLPTAGPTPQPIAQAIPPASSSPSAGPTPLFQPTNPDGGPCGDGTVGNGICANKTECCSRDGFCGTDDIHCNWGTCPCGDGKVGNGRCEDTTLCCSIFGWCGDSAEYCNGAPHPTPLPSPSSAPSGSPSKAPFAGGQPEPFCGGGVVGNGQCEIAGECCSPWGYCGSGVEWCGGYCGNGNIGNGICETQGHCCSQDGMCGTEYCVGTTPCGNNEVGNGKCETPGECCSPWGWCGTTPEHCGEGSGGDTPPPTPGPIVPAMPVVTKEPTAPTPPPTVPPTELPTAAPVTQPSFPPFGEVRPVTTPPTPQPVVPATPQPVTQVVPATPPPVTQVVPAPTPQPVTQVLTNGPTFGPVAQGLPEDPCPSAGGKKGGKGKGGSKSKGSKSKSKGVEEEDEECPDEPSGKGKGGKGSKSKGSKSKGSKSKGKGKSKDRERKELVEDNGGHVKLVKESPTLAPRRRGRRQLLRTPPQDE